MSIWSTAQHSDDIKAMTFYKGLVIINAMTFYKGLGRKEFE